MPLHNWWSSVIQTISVACSSVSSSSWSTYDLVGWHLLALPAVDLNIIVHSLDQMYTYRYTDTSDLFHSSRVVVAIKKLNVRPFNLFHYLPCIC